MKKYLNRRIQIIDLSVLFGRVIGFIGGIATSYLIWTYLTALKIDVSGASKDFGMSNNPRYGYKISSFILFPIFFSLLGGLIGKAVGNLTKRK